MRSRRHAAALLLAGLAAAGPVPHLEAQLVPPSLRAFPTADANRLNVEAQALVTQAEERRVRRTALLAQAAALEANPGVADAVAALQREVTTLTADANRLENEALSQDGAAGAFATRRTELDARIRELEGEVTQATYELALLEAETLEGDSSAVQRATLEGEIRTLNRDLETARAERDQAVQRETAARERASANRETAEALRREAATKQSVIAGLQQDQDVRAAATALREEAARLQARERELREQAGQRRAEAEAIARNIANWFLPVRNEEEAARFYGQNTGFSFIRTANVTLGNGGNGAATVEMTSAFAGPVRLALTGVVAKADEPEAADTTAASQSDVQRFFAGGGNLVVSGGWPVMATAGRFSGVLQLLGKTGFDLPAGGLVDAPMQNVPLNLDLGPDLYFSVHLDRAGEWRLFGFGRAAGVVGTTRFNRQMGRGSNRPFGYAQGLAGLEIQNMIRFLFSTTVAPDRIAPRGVRLTVQLTPPVEQAR